MSKSIQHDHNPVISTPCQDCPPICFRCGQPVPKSYSFALCVECKRGAANPVSEFLESKGENLDRMEREMEANRRGGAKKAE